MKKNFLFGFAVVALLVACSKDPEDVIVGTWYNTDNTTEHRVFMLDGEVFSDESFPIPDATIEWDFREGGTLYVFDSRWNTVDPMAYRYSVNDYYVSIFMPDGNSEIYEFQRVKKKEMVLEQRPVAFVDSTTVPRRVCITDGHFVFSKKR